MVEPDVALIIVAAGSGERMGAAGPKVFLELGARSLLAHAISRAVASGVVASLVVMAPPTHLAETTAVVGSLVPEGTWHTVVPGGAERGKSVAGGLRALVAHRRAERIVLVHDAARPLAAPELFRQVAAAIRHGALAVVPGVPVVDTIKRIGTAGRVIDTPDRQLLRAIQTPQGFARDVLERAHARAKPASDDAALVEELGLEVRVIAGSPAAMKITYPADLVLAERFLAEEV